jgi:hypothetical protein
MRILSINHPAFFIYDSTFLKKAIIVTTPVKRAEHQRGAAARHRSYLLGRRRGPGGLAAGGERGEKAVEEPAAAGRGDRERGSDDGEDCGDPGEAQEGLERGPVARPHGVRGRRASRDAGTGARCGNETRRRAGRVCALECGGNRREHEREGTQILGFLCFPWRGGFRSVPSGSGRPRR